MTAFQSSYKVLVLDNILPCGNFKNYNGGPLKTFFAFFSTLNLCPEYFCPVVHAQVTPFSKKKQVFLK